MFLETDINRTLSALSFLLAALMGVAPIVVTLWVKLVLYRRRTAEDNEEALRLENEREADHARERLRRRYLEMVRAFPQDFQPNGQLGLYVSRQPTRSRATANATSDNSQTKPAQR